MDDLELAEHIYAGRALLAEARPTPGAIGIAEIMQFFDAPSSTLDHAQTRYLFSHPRLRDAYVALRRTRVLMDVPLVAAASDGEVGERRFDGGIIRITRVDGDPHAYVLISFDTISAVPASLVLETASGILIKIEIPAPDSEGEAMIVLDKGDSHSYEILKALIDPSTKGSFLSN